MVCVGSPRIRKATTGKGGRRGRGSTRGNQFFRVSPTKPGEWCTKIACENTGEHGTRGAQIGIGIKRMSVRRPERIAGHCCAVKSESAHNTNSEKYVVESN